MLKDLDNPYIIKVYEFYEDSEKIYIVMQYCKGGDLCTEINKRKNEYRWFSEK